MAERVPRDRKVPSSNPALHPMRRFSKYNSGGWQIKRNIRPITHYLLVITYQTYSVLLVIVSRLTQCYLFHSGNRQSMPLPFSFQFLKKLCNRTSFCKAIKTLNIEYVNKIFASQLQITFSSNFLRIFASKTTYTLEFINHCYMFVFIDSVYLP